MQKITVTILSVVFGFSALIFFFTKLISSGLIESITYKTPTAEALTNSSASSDTTGTSSVETLTNSSIVSENQSLKERLAQDDLLLFNCQSSTPSTADFSSIFYVNPENLEIAKLHRNDFVSPIQIVTSTDWSAYKIVLGYRTVTRIPIKVAIDSVPDQISIFRKTLLYTYVQAEPTSLVRIQNWSGAVDKITRNDGAAIGDISPNESIVAWSLDDDSGKKIIFENLNNHLQVTFAVPTRFKQFGFLHFSNDGTRLAYSAATGNPNAEEGTIFVIDLKKFQQFPLIFSHQNNGYFVVNGWKNNIVDYESKTVGDLFTEPDNSFNE